MVSVHECVSQEIQGDWIVNCVRYMMEKNLTRIEADTEAELNWRQRVLDASARGLWSKAKSWYMGANIPGKAIEPLNWAGGVQNYDRICIEVAGKGYEGFTTS